ncbi:MAG: DNA methyltransferase [Candidatus ainarchaeum sp.]|nr:DNA methyltransferase [Candidatus ainarchaeum sp.]
MGKWKPELWTTYRGNNTYPIYNWFYFTEAYSRGIVNKYIKKYEIKGKVLDPFCGTGTTLLVAKENGLKATGYDLSKLMALVSKAKTQEYDIEKLESQVVEFFGLEKKKQEVKVPDWIKQYFHKEVLDSLLELKERINTYNTEYKEFFLLVLMRTLDTVSKAKKVGKSLQKRVVPIFNVYAVYEKLAKAMIKDLKRAERKKLFSGAAEVYNNSMYEIPENKKYDLIITSPPYLNKTEYTKRFGIELWFLGEETYLQGLGNEKEQKQNKECLFYTTYFADILDKIRDGSEHKMVNYSVDNYFSGLEAFFKKSYSLLNKGGLLVVVIAGGCFKNYAVDIYDYVCKLSDNLGFKFVESEVNRELICHKNRTQKIGKVKEFTIVLKK